MNILSLIIWLPIIFGALILIFSGKDSARFARWVALLGATLSFVVTIALVNSFDAAISAMQFSEKYMWMPSFQAYYSLGVDGISLWLVVLTSFITVLGVLTAWQTPEHGVAQYMAAILILSGLLLGAFCALDGLLFYLFFEATLIPMYILIGKWGGPNRIYASFKFFLYTLSGSLLALIAIIYLYQQTYNFDIYAWHKVQLTLTEQLLLFIAFFAAFAVKVPMWPLHTWLPDAHVQAPTAGSIILAAVMLKLGAYGFLRFNLPITPDASYELAPIMLSLSLVAIIYIGLVALVQTDIKKLVAYSSVAHMGFVTLGMFIFKPIALTGVIVQMLSHGLISAAMFLCIGVLYERANTREIADYGGIAKIMPKFSVFAVFFALANCGLPATSGFVGEFMIILGSVQFNFWLGVLAATSLVLGAAYSLWMVKRVIFGAVKSAKIATLCDLNLREFFLLFILAALVLTMGLYPKLFTEPMITSVSALLKHSAISKIPL